MYYTHYKNAEYDGRIKIYYDYYFGLAQGDKYDLDMGKPSMKTYNETSLRVWQHIKPLHQTLCDSTKCCISIFQ